jgi:hypothetical protein
VTVVQGLLVVAGAMIMGKLAGGAELPVADQLKIARCRLCACTRAQRQEQDRQNEYFHHCSILALAGMAKLK